MAAVNLTPALTLERLRELFNFDPLTGLLTWAVDRRYSIKSGDPAGTLYRGYVKVKVEGRRYSGHRICWAMHYGEWPSTLIDHINGDRSDNRIENLRCADEITNSQNMRAALKSNKLGVLGVHARKDRPGLFRASITVNHKKINLGSWGSQEEAHKAYLEAKRKLHAGCTI